MSTRAVPQITRTDLARWLKRNNLTKSEACRLLGCSRQSLDYWLSGKREIKRYLALALLAIEADLDPASLKRRTPKRSEP